MLKRRSFGLQKSRISGKPTSSCHTQKLSKTMTISCWLLLLLSSSSVAGFVSSNQPRILTQQNGGGVSLPMIQISLHASPFGIRKRIKREFKKLRKRGKDDDGGGEMRDFPPSVSSAENMTTNGTEKGGYLSTIQMSAESQLESYDENGLQTTISDHRLGRLAMASTVAVADTKDKQINLSSSGRNDFVDSSKDVVTVDGDHSTLADAVECVNSTESILSPDLPLPERERIQIKKLYTLSPVDRDLTRLEREFREMIEFFSQFTEADLYTIRDPRVRTIFEGVIASSDEAAVYRAFEVLFEDLAPLRIAGRMIYSKLKQVMEQAQSRGKTEVDAIVTTTGLPPDRVEASRLAFLTLAVATEHGHDEEAYLSIEQLVDTGLAETAMQLLGYSDMNDFLKNVDHNQDDKVTFAELMVGLQVMAEETCAVEKCDPAVVLQSVVNQVGPSLANPSLKLDRRRQEYSDKFDEMVGAFQNWQDVVPKGEGRRLDVLRGCFVGAANSRVVEALRVVYLDYSALRIAGNTIFSLMSALVTQLRKRQQAGSKKST